MYNAEVTIYFCSAQKALLDKSKEGGERPQAVKWGLIYASSTRD
jgi:hypothetical protein